MPKKYTDEEYAKILPKKQVGTAVIFFNTKGELLIVKPDYKDCWLVPGGAINDDESPLLCGIREVKEEIGLNIPGLKLCGVFYGPRKGFYTDFLRFVFYGGILADNQISQIKLQADELLEYKFMTVTEALPLLSANSQKYLTISFEAIKNNTVAYIE